MVASRFVPSDHGEVIAVNWSLLFEAMLGKAPGFSPAETRKLRLMVSGIAFVGVFSAWTMVGWMRAPAAAVAVRGRLTFQGSPVEVGEIEFAPAVGEIAQRHTVKVENGEFVLPARQGLVRNKKYVVRAKAFRKTGRVYANARKDDSAAEFEQYLPERYNSESELSFLADRASAAKGLDLDLE